MKVWILQNQMRTEKQMRAAALRHRIFFFLALQWWDGDFWNRPIATPQCNPKVDRGPNNSHEGNEINKFYPSG